MPFYGRFDYFRGAVDSVLGQTEPDWRLVIVDDRYPDPAPGEWALALGDDRITYSRNKTNLGVAGSFRNAAAIATADHVVIMGCDDILLPGYVARMKTLAAAYPEAAIIQPGVTVIDENGAPSGPLGDRVKNLARIRGSKPALYGGQQLARSLLRGNWTYFPSICWRTDFLKRHEFRSDFDVVLDLALQLEIIQAGGLMLVDDEKTFAYRRHSTSVSSWTANDGTRFVQESALFDESARALGALGWTSAARAARIHLTSRLNALTKIPQSLRPGSSSSRRLLLRHLFGR
jgi:glycosyltransferase involved in cell wall biosynthesis